MPKLPFKLKLPKFARISAKERLLALLCATVVVVGMMDRVVVTPWMRRGATLQREIHAFESAMANQRKLVSCKDSVLAQAQRYEEYLRPGSEKELQIATLLKEIEGLAKQAQAALEEVKPLPGTDSDLYLGYAFEVHSKCSLAQWVRFVYLIETSRSLFEIERAKVEVKEGNPDVLDATLRIATIALRGSGSP